MKHFTLVLLVAITLSIAFVSCDSSRPSANVKMKSFADSLSYTLGYIYGDNIAETGYNFNLKMVYKGIVNAHNKSIELLTEDQMDDLLTRFYEEMSGQRQAEAAEIALKNQAAGQAFMAKNAQNPEVKTTDSGIQYRVIKSGTGKQLTDGSVITAHYTGKFVDGEVFDSSYERGEPQTFNISEVIEGWSEGLKLMKVGDTFELVIPDYLAYGEMGFEIIEPGAYLIFEVEVLSSNN